MLKRAILRIVVKFNKKQLDHYLSKLSIEEKYVYDIASKLISDPNSVLEVSPQTEIIYIKNELKLLKMDFETIHFVNGKYSYSFKYDRHLIGRLRRFFNRHKEISISQLVKEVSNETTEHLKNIYLSLTVK